MQPDDNDSRNDPCAKRGAATEVVVAGAPAEATAEAEEVVEAEEAAAADAVGSEKEDGEILDVATTARGTKGERAVGAADFVAEEVPPAPVVVEDELMEESGEEDGEILEEASPHGLGASKLLCPTPCAERIGAPVAIEAQASAHHDGRDSDAWHSPAEHLTCESLEAGEPCWFGWRCKYRSTCSYYHGAGSHNSMACACDDTNCPLTHPRRANSPHEPPGHGGLIGGAHRDYWGSGVWRSGGRRPPASYVCKFCKATDHYLKECPLAVCVRCGRQGHTAPDCTWNGE